MLEPSYKATVKTESNFLKEYKEDIEPKIKAIDLYLKTHTTRVSLDKISQLLYISKDEVNQIAKKNNITNYNSYTFYSIMLNGSSKICSLFRREMDRGTPSIYSIEDVSYIYDIDIDTVQQAAYNSGLKKLTSATLPLLFTHIPSTI